MAVRQLVVTVVALVAVALVVVALVAVALGAMDKKASKPNILYILTDDLGWNEVSWNNPDVITPNIQTLADDGVVLVHHYANSLCTPSRSALMTATYAHKLGRQRFVVNANMPSGLTTKQPIMPERFKDLGYGTHIVGKWNLGFCNWSYTPTYRGFDSFYGYYNAQEDYYTHIEQGGYDMRDGEEVAWAANGTYSLDLFIEKAVDVIESYKDKEEPFFLYLATQNVHYPFEAPDRFLEMYPDEEDEYRHPLLAMVTAMDEGVGKVLDALKATGQYDDTIIVWTSDNGGCNVKENNTPLRGYKGSIFEGGTRVPTVVRSPLLEATPRTFNGLMHIVDWQDTLLDAVGAGEVDGDDGMSLWKALRTPNIPSPRNEFFYNLDVVPIFGINGGIRVGPYKYMRGFMLYTNETGPWLFNLEEDPSETTNLLEVEPEVALELQARLEAETENIVIDHAMLPEPAGHPDNWGGVWSPGWCKVH